MSLFQIPFVRQLQTLGLFLLSTLGIAGQSVPTRSEAFNSTHPPEEVTFLSDKLILHGFIHKPEGDGPFPAILWNHGSEQFPESGQFIAEPYVNKGYVVFFPHRRGQGYSSDQSEYIMDLILQKPKSSRGKKFVELQEIHQQDVIAVSVMNYSR
jgi:hypothetical protein